MCNTIKRLFSLVQLRWPFLLLAIVALLHILTVIKVDGYGIGLILIAFLPALLPIIAKYIKTFKFGKNGLEASTVADNDGKSASDLETREAVANSKDPNQAEFPYTVESRHILSTLWHFQKQLFGEDSLRRWGFGIGVGSLDYAMYSRGLQPLVQDGIVHADRRGLCYLTNEGVDFCKQHTAILDGDGPYFEQFSPVE